MDLPLIMKVSLFNDDVFLCIVLMGVASLIVTFIFRDRPWSVFVWFPIPATTVVIAYGYWAITSNTLAHTHDGTFAGVAAIFTSPLFVICEIVLVLSWFSRPRKEVFRVTTLGLAILIYGVVCIGAGTKVYFAFTDEWILLVKDASGAPVPNTLVDFHLVAEGRTLATKRADHEGRIRIRIMGKFYALIHSEDTQDRVTGRVRPIAFRNNKTRVFLEYQWITLIAGERATNCVIQEVPCGSPPAITLYIASSRSLPMNPVLRQLDKQFAESPMEAIRACQMLGEINLITLRHLDVIKAEFDKGNISPFFFADVNIFVGFLERALNRLTWLVKDRPWSTQDFEDLHTLYLLLSKEEPDNLTPAEKLESLKKLTDSLRKELKQLERQGSARSIKERSQ
ncbi:MAG: hypothetical protein NTY01_21575 [Verrucomicrobia bacterium]|nr:hypothetical protein [Verrucomicrobiota bacterium]